MQDAVYQSHPRIRRAAKGTIVIVAHSGAQSEIMQNRKLTLRIESPDKRISGERSERGGGSCGIALVLPQIVDDFRAQRNFVLCRKRAANLRFAIPPVAPERVGVCVGRVGRYLGGIDHRRLQSGLVVGCAGRQLPLLGDTVLVAQIKVLMGVEVLCAGVVETRCVVSGWHSFVSATE